MFNSYYDWFWFISALVASVLPLILIKKYIEKNNILYMAAAIIIYVLLIFIYYKLFINNNMSTIYPLIKIISIILVVILGIFLFGENINLIKLIGILLGIISVYLLTYFK